MRVFFPEWYCFWRFDLIHAGSVWPKMIGVNIGQTVRVCRYATRLTIQLWELHQSNLPDSHGCLSSTLTSTNHELNETFCLALTFWLVSNGIAYCIRKKSVWIWLIGIFIVCLRKISFDWRSCSTISRLQLH